MAFLSKAFLDESGGPDTSTFVLGGYAGDVEMWGSFSEEWQRVLDRYDIPVFHMHKCESGKEDGFECLDEKDRLDLCLALVDVIRDHKPLAFTCEISSVAWREVVESRITKSSRISTSRPYRVLSRTYGFGAALIALHLGALQDHRRVQLGKIDMIFDWQQQYEKAAKTIVDEDIIPWLLAEEPVLGLRMGSTFWPKPNDRDNYVPLQAADMLVWHRRRCRDYEDGPGRPVWKELEKAAKPAMIQATRQMLETEVERGPLAQLIRRWNSGREEPEWLDPS